MSGASSIRGYLLQTLIGLLDSLLKDNQWEQLSIEPINESQKVDIVWYYKDKKKVVQVKSSQNQISKRHVMSWAKELEDSTISEDYELVLIGPVSQSVLKLKDIGKVMIPMPKNLDISGMIEQTAHRLDQYLESKHISKVPSFARELIVNALISKLENYSTKGESITRLDFNQLIDSWILMIYPNCINQALSMQSDILCDSIFFATPSAESHDSFAIVLPMIIVNNSVRPSIINWIAIKIISKTSTKLYTPIAFINLEKLIHANGVLHASNLTSQFSEFIVNKNGSIKMNILFSQEDQNKKFPFNKWIEDEYVFKIYVKFNDNEIPILKKELKMEITNELIEKYKNGHSYLNSIRDIDF